MRYTIKPGHCIERDGKPFLRLFERRRGDGLG